MISINRALYERVEAKLQKTGGLGSMSFSIDRARKASVEAKLQKTDGTLGSFIKNPFSIDRARFASVEAKLQKLGFIGSQ